MRLVELQVALVRDGRPKYEVATAAKMHPTRLSQILHGRATPSASERERLASALGLDEATLFQDVLIAS